MAKLRYLEENNNKYKKTIIILIILILILFIVSLILANINKNNQTPELSYDNLKTVKEVIEYYKSKYISEKISDDKKYSLEVYLTLIK